MWDKPCQMLWRGGGEGYYSCHVQISSSLFEDFRCTKMTINWSNVLAAISFTLWKILKSLLSSSYFRNITYHLFHKRLTDTTLLFLYDIKHLQFNKKQKKTIWEKTVSVKWILHLNIHRPPLRVEDHKKTKKNLIIL